MDMEIHKAIKSQKWEEFFTREREIRDKATRSVVKKLKAERKQVEAEEFKFMVDQKVHQIIERR